MKEQILREACVETKEEIDAAVHSGADRIELCSRLDVGGFTPLPQAVEYALAQKLNVAIMIRATEDFNIHGNITLLKTQMNDFGKTGISGFVFGFLTKDGKIDAGVVRELCLAAGSKEKIFHMAFDELTQNEQLDAIDMLAEMGFTRILTKGGIHSAEDNIEHLKHLNERALANGKISILCGGSVTDANYRTIAEQTGIRQFHGRKLACC
ncbi:MAG: copper homeostasis protein CutC [Termitinemataceae bacterium]|nr:MAG: copper homeostasis protein CutC [Termitinemataceae bacterium]